MKSSSIVINLMLVLFATGCVAYAPNVEVTHVPDPASGYVYGRFQITRLGDATIALKIADVSSGKEHILEFKEKDGVSAIKVEPGEYKIKSMVGLAGFAKARINERFFDTIKGYETLSKPFLIGKNEAIYIGDYIAQFSVQHYVVAHQLNWQWYISNKYEDTSREFLVKHNAFTATATRRCTCIP